MGLITVPGSADYMDWPNWGLPMTNAVNDHEVRVAALESQLTATSCIARRVANQLVPHATDTPLLLDTEDVDTASMFTATDSKIYAPVVGVYQVSAFGLVIGANFLILNIKLNGVTIIGPAAPVDASGAVRVNASTAVRMTAGQYVEAVVYQSSGGSASQNVTGRLTVVRGIG